MRACGKQTCVGYRVRAQDFWRTRGIKQKTCTKTYPTKYPQIVREPNQRHCCEQRNGISAPQVPWHTSFSTAHSVKAKSLLLASGTRPNSWGEIPAYMRRHAIIFSAVCMFFRLTNVSTPSRESSNFAQTLKDAHIILST